MPLQMPVETLANNTVIIMGDIAQLQSATTLHLQGIKSGLLPLLFIYLYSSLTIYDFNSLNYSHLITLFKLNLINYITINLSMQIFNKILLILYFYALKLFTLLFFLIFFGQISLVFSLKSFYFFLHKINNQL